MRILYVCTANICRSASAQQLLRDAVAVAPELAAIEVRSAGTAAVAGSPGCPIAPALVGCAAEHASQPLTADLVDWADLILPAARDHRAAIVELSPASRSRTFTIRQAGRIADWIVDSGMVAAGLERAAVPAEAEAWGESRAGAETAGSPGAGGGERAGQSRGTGGEAPGAGVEAWGDRFPLGDPRREVQALPADVAGRRLWIVSEMDAARGLTGTERVTSAGAPPMDPRRRWRLGRAGRSRDGVDAGVRPGSSGERPTDGWDPVDPSELHPDDVPDPHVLGTRLHPLSYEQIRVSTEALVRLLREVASAG